MQPVENPQRDHEYIVQLRHFLTPNGLEAARGVEIELHYVPDRLMLLAEKYDQYLHYFETQAEGYTTFEKLAGDILDDLNNELVPLWIHIQIQAEHAHAIHRVSFEARQPNWDNRYLLSRLKQI